MLICSTHFLLGVCQEKDFSSKPCEYVLNETWGNYLSLLNSLKLSVDNANNTIAQFMKSLEELKEPEYSVRKLRCSSIHMYVHPYQKVHLYQGVP